MCQTRQDFIDNNLKLQEWIGYIFHQVWSSQYYTEAICCGKNRVMNRLPPLMALSPPLYSFTSLFSTQVIQTVSAVDKDDPIQGHYFDYRLVPEMLNNPNFTIKNNQGERLKSARVGTFLWQNDWSFCKFLQWLSSLIPNPQHVSHTGDEIWWISVAHN